MHNHKIHKILNSKKIDLLISTSSAIIQILETPL